MKYLPLLILPLILLGAGCSNTQTELPEETNTLNVLEYTGDLCSTDTDCTIPSGTVLKDACAMQASCVSGQCAVLCAQEMEEVVVDETTEEADTIEHEDEVTEEVQEEKKQKNDPVEEPPTQQPQGDTISLSQSGSTGVSWNTSFHSEKGFKVVWSKNTSPTYPTRSGDKYKYLSSPEANSQSLYAFDGSGTYYIRVCEYLGGTCGTYSNQITMTLTAEEKKEEPKEHPQTTAVQSISLSASGEESVSWAVNGTSTKGFKVVWSKNTSPTYPTRSGDKYAYLSSATATSQKLTDFDGPGTYYVRVCEYLGGACGVYSNQITMELE